MLSKFLELVSILKTTNSSKDKQNILGKFVEHTDLLYFYLDKTNSPSIKVKAEELKYDPETPKTDIGVVEVQKWQNDLKTVSGTGSKGTKKGMISQFTNDHISPEFLDLWVGICCFDQSLGVSKHSVQKKNKPFMFMSCVVGVLGSKNLFSNGILDLKYDGIRAILTYDNGKISIRQKNIESDKRLGVEDGETPLPVIAQKFEIDGELIMYDGNSTSNDVMKKDQKIRMVGFDLISWDQIPSISVAGESLEVRRQYLKTIHEQIPQLFSLPEHIDLRNLSATPLFQEVFQDPQVFQTGLKEPPQEVNPTEVIKKCLQICKEKSLEGVVYKDRTSKYVSGKHKEWKKYKNERETLDLLAVKSYPGEGKLKNYNVVFDMHSTDNGQSVFVCKLLVANVEIAQQIQEGQTVVEVRYSSLREKKKQSEGGLSFGVIQPTFKKIREDKTPAEITTVSEILKLVECQQGDHKTA